MDAANILIIEDDAAIGTLVRDILASEGYETRVVPTYRQAEQEISARRPDLIILDLMLPDTDGLVALASIRPRLGIPVILLSATQRRADSVLGLKLGADDFISKPFDPFELLARVEAVLRRTGQPAPAPAPARTGVVQLGDLSIDPTRHEVRIGDRSVNLTPTEFRLLTHLASRPNVVQSREELARALWAEEVPDHLRVVDVHIRRLRQKLASGNGRVPPIVTVRGFGYKLVS